MSYDPTRLDASESLWFKRELEAIDTRLYQTIYPDNQARAIVPTIDGVPEDVRVHTWRRVQRFGQAKILSNMADDLPRADVAGEEMSTTIKTVGASYGWDLDEVKAAARTGTPLPREKADAAHFFVDTEVDRILSLGDTNAGLVGLLSVASGTTSFAPGPKSGGGTAWENGTSDEIVADIFGIFSAIVNALKASGGMVFQKYRLCLPTASYSLIAQKRMGDGSDKTILQFVKENSPYIESIVQWYRCDTAGTGSVKRMCAFVPNTLCVGSLMAQEFQTQPPQQRNLSFVINCTARTGGVEVKLPMAIAYGDGI